jgi:hypothetical protein
MNKTLKDFLKHSDEFHDYIEKFCIILSVETIEEKMLELQAEIKTIQAVAKRMADVSNIAARIITRKKQEKKINTKNTKFIDPYPSERDHATLRNIYPDSIKKISPTIDLMVKYVPNIEDIPVTNLYYVENLKQFAVNINGIIIKGNLANIVEYQTEKSARCEYGIECKTFIKDSKCKYYHEPEDYIKLKREPIEEMRNFTVGSWLYSKTKKCKNYFTRHIGNYANLEYDLNTLKKVQYREEIDNREGQLIHDILIYMILNTKGFLEKYPHWIK